MPTTILLDSAHEPPLESAFNGYIHSRPAASPPGAVSGRPIDGPSAPQAASVLLPKVYDELLCLARTRLARCPASGVGAPGELVHEAYLRLVAGGRTDFEGRRHLIFTAARAMGDIVVEKRRQQASLKRGGHTEHVTLDTQEIAVTAPEGQALDLMRALEGLESECRENAEVVRLKYFNGLTQPEIGEALGISRATVERRWARARIWLRRHLSPPQKATKKNGHIN